MDPCANIEEAWPVNDGDNTEIGDAGGGGEVGNKAQFRAQSSFSTHKNHGFREIPMMLQPE
jgi:hypothetical protein